MRAQPCRPEDIRDVNKHKEYTLIATDLLESVLTDTRLNAQTTKLWQILFNKVRYNQNLEIKISYSYLGKKLGKSARTIARYVDALQNAGYLVVKHNFDKNGGQRPSTISVRAPENSIVHIKNRKDRLDRNRSNNDETLLKNEENLKSRVFSVRQSAELLPVDVTETQKIEEPINVLCETSKNTPAEKQIGQEPSTYLNELSYMVSDTTQNSCDKENRDTYKYKGQEVLVEVTEQHDKNDIGGHDKNVLHNNKNKKEINKNNNNTVVPFTQNEERTALEKEIRLLEISVDEKAKQLVSITDYELLYDKIREHSRLDSSLHLARIALERLNKEIEERSVHEKTEIKLNSDSCFILKKPGDRPLSQFTFKRLIKSLEAYGYEGFALNSLANEVVFEVRFGSLMKCNKTKNSLSLDNAINIGLKLIRENRWSTPALLEKYAHTDFYQA